MTRPPSVVVPIAGATGAVANVPALLGAPLGPYVGGYIIGCQVSWSVGGALALPNRLQVYMGSAVAPLSFIADFYGIPTPNGTIVIPMLGDVARCFGLEILGTATSIWATSVHSNVVAMVITMTIWPP